MSERERSPAPRKVLGCLEHVIPFVLWASESLARLRCRRDKGKQWIREITMDGFGF